MMNFMNNLGFHNASDAAQCLIEDFDSYLDGSCDPDYDCHQCSRDNVMLIQESLEVVRELGAAIESGDTQLIADIWLKLKPQVELHNAAPSVIVDELGCNKMITIDESIERIKREIIDDIKAGRVPADCPSFSALHDYVDANCYGGFCDDFGGLTAAALNEAQNSIDHWIKEGGIHIQLESSGITIADLEDDLQARGRINRPKA